MILRYLFSKDYCAAEAGVAAALVHAGWIGEYRLAVAIFVVGVAVNVAGAIALEKQGRDA